MPSTELPSNSLHAVFQSESLPSVPFEASFSLVPLVRRLRELASYSGPTAQHFALLCQQLETFPNALESFKGDLPESLKPAIELAMTTLFPVSKSSKTLEAVSIPFHEQTIWSNPVYREVFGEGFATSAHSSITREMVVAKRTRYAVMEILHRHYGLVPRFDPGLVIPVNDAKTGLVRYFKAQINTEFTDIDTIGAPPEINAAILEPLIRNESPIDEWLKIVRPEHFVFSGFAFLSLTEVTQQEVLSSLKYDLLQRDALLSDEGTATIESRLRSFFQHSGLKFGIAAFNPENATLSRFGKRVWRSLLPSDSMDFSCAMYHGCIYEKMTIQAKPIIVEDLEKLAGKTYIEDLLLKRGLRSIIVAPLLYDDEIIGVFELGSPVPDTFSALSKIQLHELVPLFSIALKRCLDELSNQIQAIIKLNCSALHPSVEWKFEEEALRILEQRKDGPWELPNLHFNDVYPLFGAADIRGSSTARAEAIQHDLLKHLRLFKGLLDKAISRKYVPIVDGLLFEVEEQIFKLAGGIQSGDENAVLHFLQQKVDSSLAMLADRGLLDREEIADYRTHIDSKHGILYEKRKAFEDSISIINTSISQLLDEEEVAAQRIFPHFFEKYKTDGVEYNIYLGRELNKINAFDPVYLKNLRLWQLMMTCKIQDLANRNFHKLPLPFEITQLVLVHSAPLSIVFRTDDKKFDVDGAYNIRYEIIKKRIDKALIKNTQERLTQPGKLAIIYVHDAEAEEYRGYLRFLHSRGFFEANVEQLELQELAGASGLKALRATYQTKKP